MSPRQTQAYLSLALDRRREELGELLAIHALAARGEGEAINQRLREFTEG
jgi:hypothetical protein